MNTPIPPKCLSIEINDVIGSMIRLISLPSGRVHSSVFLAGYWECPRLPTGTEAYHRT